MLLEQPRIQTAKAMAPRDTADGSPAEMPVFMARPEGAAAIRRPGLLLIQEIFGVNSHIQDVVRRFAAQGFVVVAPDLFHRSAHWLAFDYQDREPIQPILAGLKAESLLGDLRAALDFLAAQPDVDPERIGVVGYCMGGRLAFASAANFPELIKAAAVYYGGGIVPAQPASDGSPAPVPDAARVRAPVIGFFGAEDKHIPPAAVQRLEQALTQAGVTNRIYLYPGVDHGFFCDARASFHPQAAQDAWVRTLRFFGEHLGPVTEAPW